MIDLATERGSFRRLTRRQVEALRLSCRCSNHQIAERMAITEGAVKLLLSEAYRRLENQGFRVHKMNKRAWFCYLLGVRETIDRLSEEDE